MRVEIWSDVVCPWCYLGKEAFRASALEEFGHGDEVEVVHRSFEEGSTPAPTPRSTVPTLDLLASKYRMSTQQADAAQREMEQRAAAEGLDFHLEDLESGNTRDAHRLIHLAGSHGLQAEMVERLHRAYFTEQASVFDVPALTELGVSVGLERETVIRVLSSDDFADAVVAEEAEAHALGANGVPFFVIDRRYGVSGAQEPATLRAALEQAWADSHASPAAAVSPQR